VSEDVSIAQIVTTITTVFYAGVFAIGYYLLIKGNRETLRETREQRISGAWPQVHNPGALRPPTDGGSRYEALDNTS
jgi:hypothetical protein